MNSALVIHNEGKLNILKKKRTTCYQENPWQSLLIIFSPLSNPHNKTIRLLEFVFNEDFEKGGMKISRGNIKGIINIFV